jgi:hypothetical protein
MFLRFYHTLNRNDSGYHAGGEGQESFCPEVHKLYLGGEKDQAAGTRVGRLIKYTVLDGHHRLTPRLRQLLRDKTNYPAAGFIPFGRCSCKVAGDRSAINAAQHVWGYFKDVAQ